MLISDWSSDVCSSDLSSQLRRSSSTSSSTIAGDGMMSETSLATESTQRSRTSWRAAFMVPVVLFLVLAVALAWGLTRDPRELPSALIGKPVPDFSLPPVQGRTLGLSSADLKGEVSLVNVFASWCTACREEHPLFMQIKADNVVPIHGLNHRDRSSEKHT